MWIFLLSFILWNNYEWFSFRFLLIGPAVPCSLKALTACILHVAYSALCLVWDDPIWAFYWFFEVICLCPGSLPILQGSSLFSLWKYSALVCSLQRWLGAGDEGSPAQGYPLYLGHVFVFIFSEFVKCPRLHSLPFTVLCLQVNVCGLPVDNILII